MRSFLIALTFLTRISLFAPTDWKEDDFKKSVKFFPLAGGILGFFYAGIAYIFTANDNFIFPQHLFVASLIFLIFFLSGGLFFDGFMDTVDGIFSGREREKILNIMKDSRVGANAVMAFVLYMIFLYSVLLDIDKNKIIFPLFIAPIISHFMVVVSIKFFPYARKEGIGKMFSVDDDFFTILVALLFTLALLVPCGILAYGILFINLLFTILFNRYLVKLLGGLTGDTYGAVASLSFLLTFILFYVFRV